MNTSLFRLRESRSGRSLRSLLAPAAQAGPAAVTRPEARHKILIVDDDPVILKAMSLKLSSRGYAVVTATDASEAIAAVRDEKPHLVLLDLSFPPDIANGGRVTWDGFQIMSWLRGLEEANRLPFIIITGGEPAVYQERALANGAAGFFPKPIDHDDLLQVIRRTLDGSEN